MMRFDFEAARDAAVMAIGAVFLLLTPLAFMITGAVVGRQGISGYNVAMQLSLWSLLAIGAVAFLVVGFLRGGRKES